jgi:hypothetical protein
MRIRAAASLESYLLRRLVWLNSFAFGEEIEQILLTSFLVPQLAEQSMLIKATSSSRIRLPSCWSSWRRSFGHHDEAFRRVLDQALALLRRRWGVAILEHVQILDRRWGRWIVWDDVWEFAFGQVLEANLLFLRTICFWEILFLGVAIAWMHSSVELIDAFKLLLHFILDQWSPEPRRTVSTILTSRKAVFGFQTQDISKTLQLRAIWQNREEKWLTDHGWFVNHLNLRCNYTNTLFSLALELSDLVFQCIDALS